MPNTYSYTNTYTFTRAEVVLAQYKIALGYANVLSKEKTELLLEAINERKIYKLGVYAFNKEHKRVMQVIIEVDWEKHEQMVSIEGELFPDGKSGFSYKKLAAVETKIFVHDMVKEAKKNGLEIGLWVTTSDFIIGEEREELLKKIGFGGKVEPWLAKPKTTSTNIKSIEEMRIHYSSAGRIK